MNGFLKIYGNPLSSPFLFENLNNQKSYSKNASTSQSRLKYMKDRLTWSLKMIRT